ncbi:TonB-dependent receptor, partial [Duganella sp. FT3S]|nr:TonB-dependent receptor [Rugamonas fusca]
MFATSTLRKAVLLSLYGSAALAMMAPASYAQTTDTGIQTVNVVGSRRVASSATDTTVPVDVIPMNKVAESGGQFDLAQTLTNISPSFNSTRQTGADGADLVDSAAL